MTSVKAAPAVSLKANDVIVAEVNDARFWQRVFTAISDGGLELEPEVGAKDSNAAEGSDSERVDRGFTRADAQPLKLLAQEIGGEQALVEGACAPRHVPPYMHLDSIAGRKCDGNSPDRGSSRRRRSHCQPVCWLFGSAWPDGEIQPRR